MISLIMSGLGLLKVAEKWQRPLAWLIAALAAVALLLGAWHLLKGSIVAQYATEQRADQAETQLKRQGQADAGLVAAEKRDQAQAANLQGAIDNGIEQHPDAAAGPAGPATSSALDELRRRQQPAPIRR